MSDRTKFGDLSNGQRVFLVLASVGLVVIAVPAIMIKLSGWALFADPYEPTRSIQNECGQPVQLSSDDLRGVPAMTSDHPWTEDGVPATIYGTGDLSIRVMGGPWTPLTIDAEDPYVVMGGDCPVGSADVWPQLVEARAPMLSGAEFVSVSVEPASAFEGSHPRGEVTTIVAKVSLDVAASWDAEYAMAAQGTPGSYGVPGVAEDAQWVASGAFDSAISASELSASATIDPATGAVIVTLWEWD